MRRIPTLLAPGLLLGLVLAVAGCGTDGPADPVPDPGVSAAPVRAGASDGDPGQAPDEIVFPRDVTSPEQGGQYVAVVLAAGSQDELDASLASVSQYGYMAGISDVACLAGAGDVLGLDEGAVVSSLLFANRRKARAFADAYVAAEDGLMVGRASVTAYCLD
ncbi:hypothetical protein [Nocardioides sp.]|uniref:hypothetical protein n=1 Tax=Nocardioides sp. TaxID=35761 RepID=UPI003219E22E